MPTIRLVPSTYYLSSSSYLSVSNASHMYNNTDNTTYAQVYNSRSSTTSYYIYVRGFNFDDIPSAAVVSDFTVKLKARESGVSTSTSYKPHLANGTSAINGTCDVITTTVATHEFTGISADWDTIKSYGDNFGIRINCRRRSRNTAAYMYIYGAEIEVTYTVPDPRTITTTLSGNGTISPSGTTTTYDGEEFELTISPTNKSDTVTATKDGVDISSELVAHGAGSSLTLTASNYSTGSGIDHYTYTYTVSGNSTIAVVIGGGAVETNKLFVKLNGTWTEVDKAYKKVNGSWTEVSIDTAFETGVKYVHGN